MPIDSRQYDSVLDFGLSDERNSKILGNIVSDDDRVRIKSYLIWEAMYSNWPEDIRITIRGDDDDSVQIYMASAKKCIEAVNRFLAVGWQIMPDPTLPAPDGDLAQSAAEVGAFMDKLFKREKLKSKFANMKRYMLIKGDALLHVRADPFKPRGRRISIDELKPEQYFPIEDADGERVGCHIVDIIPNPRTNLKLKYHKAKDLVRRQTYRRELNEAGQPTGRIVSSLGLYEVGKWDDRVLAKKDISLVESIRDEFLLPAAIQTIPVYHFNNNAPPGSTFGLSELAGVESIVQAINQSMTDEDLTLIMQGLGVYWTDAAPPLNERGEEVEWEISPRSVVQVASGGQFGRVSGISTVQPFGDHIKMLQDEMASSMGLSDLALGEVDSTIAESGIARRLKLSPLLAKNAEKELNLLDVADQFIYDLITGWFVAYEKLNTVGVSYINKFDDPLPKDKSKDLQDLLSIYGQTSNTMPVAWFYQQLNEIMGYHLDYNVDFEAALQDAIRIVDAGRGTPEPPPEEVSPGGGGGE